MVDLVHNAGIRIRELETEVARLKKRLEITHAYDGAGNEIPFPAGMEDLDGIACRDETIRQQDEQIEKLRKARDDAHADEQSAFEQKEEAIRALSQKALNAEATASSLRDRVAVLEEALKPFADYAEHMSHWGEGEIGEYFHGGFRISIRTQDLRAARTALQGGDGAA